MSTETHSRSLALGSGLDLQSTQKLWEGVIAHGPTPNTVTPTHEMEHVACEAQIIYFFYASEGMTPISPATK